MFVVVGLGNPGSRYEKTRHNVGFRVIDHLLERHGFPTLRRQKRANVSRGAVGDRAVLLAKPETYMNLSGEAVVGLLSYYKVEPANLVVVHDELDFEPGCVRVKNGGGHGGHNGLRSIVSHIGPDFVRVRMGIGKPPPNCDGADYVLGRVDKASKPLIDEAVVTAADAVESIIHDSVQTAMNRFNRKQPLEQESPEKAAD